MSVPRPARSNGRPWKPLRPGSTRSPPVRRRCWVPPRLASWRPCWPVAASASASLPTSAAPGRVRSTAASAPCSADRAGTGKTLTARHLAARLHLDVYRVDLAAVVNKYIGETERNLDRVLSRAEELDVL